LIDCGQISLERLTVKSAPGAIREMTCITVRNGIAGEGESELQSSTSIKESDLLVGHQQTGLLLVNSERITVEDNRLQSTGRPSVEGIKDRLKVDQKFRALMAVRVLDVRGVAIAVPPIRGNQPAERTPGSGRMDAVLEGGRRLTGK